MMFAETRWESQHRGNVSTPHLQTSDRTDLRIASDALAVSPGHEMAGAGEFAFVVQHLAIRTDGLKAVVLRSLRVCASTR